MLDNASRDELVAHAGCIYTRNEMSGIDFIQDLGLVMLNSLFGIQIVGIERDHRPVLSPGRSETLQSGDQLLVLGTPEQVNEMAFWLST